MTSYHEIFHGSEAFQHLKSSVGKKEIQRSIPASKQGRKEGKKGRKRERMKERRQREKRRKKRKAKCQKVFFTFGEGGDDRQ